MSLTSTALLVSTRVWCLIMEWTFRPCTGIRFMWPSLSVAAVMLRGKVSSVSTKRTLGDQFRVLARSRRCSGSSDDSSRSVTTWKSS